MKEKHVRCGSKWGKNILVSEKKALCVGTNQQIMMR